MKVLIPARGGSKGIPNKNMVEINGNPLIFYTITEALKVFKPSSVYVSSDSQEILKYSESLGVQVILRPKSASADNSTSFDVINHFLDTTCIGNLDFEIIYLQPTSPLRRSTHILEAIKIFKEKECDSLVSICESNEYPSKAFIFEGDFVRPFLDEEEYTEIRQNIPPTFYPNGAIYIFNKEKFLKHGEIPRNKIAPYIMSKVDSIDIDDSIDLEYVNIMIKK